MRKLLLTLAFVLMPVLASAADVTLVYEDYPPYEFTKDGALVGIDVDIIREAAKRAGVNPVFNEVPWKRAMEEVRTGKVDAIFSLFKTDERMEFLHFPSLSLSSEKNVAVVAKGSGKSVKSLDDLKGMTVGVVVDYAYGGEFDSMELTRDESSDNVQMLKKLAKGRTDVAVINQRLLSHLVKGGEVEDAFEPTGLVLAEEGMYVGFSKQSAQGAALAEAFSKALESMKADGFLDSVYAKY